MKKTLLILIFGISNLTLAQLSPKVSGKIIDDNLNCIPGVVVRNLNNGIISTTDSNGLYEILAKENDTLEYRMVGLTNYKMSINHLLQSKNLILINKDVNCLGAVWNEEQYRKARLEIERKLKKLYKKAKKENIWNNKCK